ncbi:hypothetical protein [Tenacibaculum sp. SDUM215027]|uniref:hypothetical protein n=1 Tax=Tenacibaculum sp. SDUM215027 TaxID=3422596 RepID=UPI003D31287A
MLSDYFRIKNSLKELQVLMRGYVGIVRSNTRLKITKAKLDIIYNEVEKLYKTSKITTTLCELRNMVTIAYLIINQSLERKESKGGYFNTDNSTKQVCELV